MSFDGAAGDAVEVFAEADSEAGFESLSRANGETYWYASDLAKLLGYQSLQSFASAVNKAMAACAALKIPIGENFREEKRELSGKPQLDWKLSRFACYLSAMNGDVRKSQVAAAQAYFASMAEALVRFIRSSEDVERMAIREDISEREKSLSGVASTAGVTEYGLFQNAGYRGMYNCNISRLREMRGLPRNRSPLDFMGKQELAANLFRITETEAKIRNSGIRGQVPCELAAGKVGQVVRETMIRTSGTRPEELSTAGDIVEVRKGLKQAHKELKQIDKK